MVRHLYTVIHLAPVLPPWGRYSKRDFNPQRAVSICPLALVLTDTFLNHVNVRYAFSEDFDPITFKPNKAIERVSCEECLIAFDQMSQGESSIASEKRVCPGDAKDPL